MNKKIFNRIISLLVAFVFVISFPLYSFAIVGGTTNEYSFTIEDVIDAYTRNDMKRLCEMVNELIPEEETEEPAIVPLWSSDNRTHSEQEMCHSFITGMGCLFYVGAIAEKGYDVSKNGITVDDIELLMEYSEKPDIEDVGILFDCHFYDPYTQKNYHGGNSTAKTKFVEYYDKAVDKYEAGDAESAFKKLGKALHFIQDVNEPHHAANITAVDEGSTHSEFEEYVSYHKERIAERFYRIGIDESVCKSTPGSLLHASANYAYLFVDDANKPKANPNISEIDPEWEWVGTITLKHAISDTVNIIYKFLKETNCI